MVKRPRIASKPTTPPAIADSWVKSGGIDPEIQQPEVTPSQAAPTPEPTPQPELPTEENKGKPYPHRISFDTTKEQYKRIKRACFETERSLNDAIREAVEAWLQEKGY